MKITRSSVMTVIRAIMSGKTKTDNENMTTTELAELFDEAKNGCSDSQVALALYYFEKEDCEEAMFWLIKAAAQGDEIALEVMEMFQGE